MGAPNEIVEHMPEVDAGEFLESDREFVWAGEVNRSKILDSIRQEHYRNGVSPEEWAGFGHPLANKAIDKAISEAIAAGIILDAREDFELVHASDLACQHHAGGWAIKGILPAQGLGSIFGPSTSAKGFFALDMLVPVANSAPWQGHRTKQMPVVIVNLEGAASYPSRLKAYETKHGPIKGPVFVLNGSSFLLTDDAQIEELAAAIEATGAAGGIVLIDTLACAGGAFDENSSEGMGAVIAGGKKLQQRVGGMVLLVHHTGKDATKGARGWSGLRAACDSEIEVARTELGRSLRLTKSKDGEDGLEWGFDLDVVQLGVDEDMDPITSCVVVEAAIPVGGIASKKLGRNQRVVYDVIMEIAKSQTAGIEVDAVVKEAARRIMELKGMESDPKGNTRGAARSALRDLLNDEGTPFFMDDEDGSTLGVC